MSSPQQFWAVFALAVKRLLSQRSLAAANLLGLVVAIALLVSIPLYAEGAYARVLREELLRATESTGQSPFAFTFHYLGSWAGAVDWQRVEGLDAYIRERASSDLRLPQELLVRSVRTDSLLLFPQDTVSYDSLRAQLGAVRMGAMSDFAEHVVVLDGAYPAVAPPTPGSPVDALISSALANKMGLQVDEVYYAVISRGDTYDRVPVRVAGIWEPRDPSESYWFREPGSLDQTLLVPEETFFERISTQLKDEVSEAVWYLVADGSGVRPSNVGATIGRILRVENTVSVLLPKTIVNSPLQVLQRYRGLERLLTIMLYAFSVPVVALNLLFISLVTRMTVDQRRREIAMLQSRGATRGQITGAAILEGVIIGLLALACGLPASVLVARVMGKTRTFLDFTAQSDLDVTITQSAGRLLAVAIGFGLLTSVLPTYRATRETIVTYSRERARNLRPPLWQRLGLDLLLLIPAAYGIYLLGQQGSLVVFVDRAVANDPFHNPLLFLVPSLTVFAVGLLILRLLPLVMRFTSWLASLGQGISFLLATRQLSRSYGFYAAPTVLLIITLSLSVFISSAAGALDGHLHDQLRYAAGAELLLSPEVESQRPEAEQSATQPLDASKMLDWYFVPLKDYLAVPGVEQACRVARHKAWIQGGATTRQATFMGLDRASFPTVAYWRADFAEESLGGLMNALAASANGVLVPREFLHEHGLGLGESLRLVVDVYGQETEIVLRVVGCFDLFPAWNPTWGLLFVGNLDYLFEQVGAELPTAVWFKLAPGASVEEVKAGLGKINPYAAMRQPAYQRVLDEQQRPERQGLFGVLSVGFVAASLLTLVGFFLYTLFSFRRRLIQLGVLRAIGLTFWQLAGYVVWELVSLVLVGLIAGTALGVATSRLFVPHFNVQSESLAQVLPISVEIAWPALFLVYALFGLLVIGIFCVSTALLHRAKLFKTVKLIEVA